MAAQIKTAELSGENQCYSRCASAPAATSTLWVRGDWGGTMRYEKQAFEGQTLRLDDNQFVECKFKNCTLLYSGGTFEIEPLVADGIEIKLEGAALSTSRLLHIVQIAKSMAVPIGAQIELGGSRFTKVANPTTPAA